MDLRIDGELITDMVGGLVAEIPGMPRVPYYTARVPLRVDGQPVPAGAKIPFGRVVMFEPLPQLGPWRVDGPGESWAGSRVGGRARLELVDEDLDRWHRALNELETRGVACPPTPRICRAECDCKRRFPWRS